MESNPEVSGILVKAGSFKDLEVPVILASGEIGIYYSNTEKVVGDNGEFERYGDNAEQMYQHTQRMMKRNPDYATVIEILAQEAQAVLNAAKANETPAISGGQRRDWLFSMPVAEMLSVPHLSIYKPEKGKHRTQVHDFRSTCEFGIPSMRLVHIADLLTEGSSFYDSTKGQPTGWIPAARAEGHTLENALVVVTRNQGGERNLLANGVTAKAMVSIDENFLGTYSTKPERAVEYIRNPRLWAEKYLAENGALAFVDTFNPDGGKIDRAEKFLKRYKTVLEQTGRFEELMVALDKKYKYSR